MADKDLGGRPKKELTEEEWTKAEQMAHIQCTGEEIAAILDINYDTLLERIKERGWGGFSDWYKKYSAGGKMSLRRRQFRTSETNPTMQIWLGKQYLGQRDSMDVDAKIDTTRAFDTSKMTKEEYMELVRSRFKKD